MSHPCPHCNAVLPTERGHKVHIAKIHGIRSQHPQAVRNAAWRANAGHSTALTDTLDNCAAYGPAGLLLAVVELANYEDRAWVDSVAQGLRRHP
jgi:hypothetical protein